MDFELPHDIRLLQDTVRKFVERELIPIEMQSMDGPDLKPDVRQRLEAKTRELGLWLLEVPADLGGQDLSLLALAVINEQLARTIALPPRGPGIVYEGRPIGGRVDIEFDIGPLYYNFIDARFIGEPVLRDRIFAPSQNVTYINQTVNVTNITVQNNVVYNYRLINKTG